MKFNLIYKIEFMAARRSLVDKVLIVLLYGKFENYKMVSREWNKYSYTTPPPKSETVAHVIKHFKENGNVDELPRSIPGSIARPL